MKNIDLSRDAINDYRDRTRPKRQRTTGYLVFIIILMFASYVYGRMSRAKEIVEQAGFSVVYAAENLSENTPKHIVQYNCSLPTTYPDPKYQSNWENLLTHCKIIEEVTGQYQGIDPELVAAIIMVESDGDFRKLSKVGAVGLMQVMPSDGYSGDTWGFNDRPITYDLFNPETNIREGVRILNDAIYTWGDLWNGLHHYVGLDSNYPNKVIDIYEALKNH